MSFANFSIDPSALPNKWPNIEPYQEELLEFLCNLCEIPSLMDMENATKEAPFGPKTLEALNYFLSHAEKLGFRTHNCEGYAGYVEFGPEDGPMIACLCHLDVVPAVGWAEAFSPKVYADKVVARGTMDDKGPAVSVLYAMKSLLDSGYEPPCTIRLILGLNEENGSECMAYYRTHEKLPVAAFTADADFPVIHAEKGRIECKLHLKEEVLKEYNLKEATPFIECIAGAASNVIPGEADLLIKDKKGNLLLSEKIQGKMGHASQPECGINAISLAMSRAEAFLNTQSLEMHPMVSSYRQLIAENYDGLGLDIAVSDEDSGPLTLNVGCIHMDSQEASCVLDIRYPVTFDGTELLKRMENRIKEFNLPIDLELISTHKPLYKEKTDELVQILSDVFTRNTGFDLPPIAIGGGTYAQAIPQTLAFGPCFPGEEGNCHQKDEQISLKTLFLSAEIYRDALQVMAEHYGEK